RLDDRSAVKIFIAVIAALGVAFLVGLVFLWRQIPLGNSYSAIFLTMIGFHAVHVMVGMLLFGYVFVKVQRGAYSKASYWGVEAAVVFWHFVEIMWVFYFLVLYLF